MKKIFDIRILITNLLVLFSVMFFSKVTKFSPVYVFILISIYIFILVLCIKAKLNFDIPSLLIFIFIVILLLNFICYKGIYTITAILGMIPYLILNNILKQIEEFEIKKIIDRFFFASLILLCIECIYRFINPVYTPEAYMAYERKGTLFYIYKFSSFMFADSNGTAMLIVILIFLSFFMKLKFREKKYKYFEIVFICLLILTFSRAAYLGFLIGKGIQKIHLLRYYRKYKKILFPILFLLLFVFILGFYSIMKDDLSFQSKFYIIKITISKFLMFDYYQKFFGIGMGNGKDTLGIFAHNVFLNYLIETGVVGVVLFFLLFVSLFYSIKSARYMIIALLISLQSSMLYSIPFFYVSIVLMKHLESKKMNKLEEKKNDNSINSNISQQQRRTQGSN